MSTTIQTIDNLDEEEIADFVSGVFRNHYRGRSIVPIWTAEYLKWNRVCSHGYHAFGAFNNGELVGFIMGFHKSYQYKGNDLDGVLGSWLSADTSKSSHLFSFKLINRLIKSAFKEATNHAKDLIIFYTDPSSGNQHLWKRMAPKIGADRIKKSSFYAKIFNVKKVLDSEWHSPLGHQFLKMKYFYDIPQVDLSHGHVRPFEKKDVDECLLLLNRKKGAAVLSRMWSKEELENQLQYRSLANSLLYYKENTLHGVINYHLLNLIGKTTIRGAFIDFICCYDLTLKEKIAFMNASLTFLKNMGCDIVLISENGMEEKIPLFLTGFVNAQRSMNTMMITNESKAFRYKSKKKVFIELR